jgi:hypothetical protein
MITDNHFLALGCLLSKCVMLLSCIGNPHPADVETRERGILPAECWIVLFSLSYPSRVEWNNRVKVAAPVKRKYKAEEICLPETKNGPIYEI